MVDFEVVLVVDWDMVEVVLVVDWDMVVVVMVVDKVELVELV